MSLPPTQTLISAHCVLSTHPLKIQSSLSGTLSPLCTPNSSCSVPSSISSRLPGSIWVLCTMFPHGFSAPWSGISLQTLHWDNHRAHLIYFFCLRNLYSSLPDIRYLEKSSLPIFCVGFFGGVVSGQKANIAHPHLGYKILSAILQ